MDLLVIFLGFVGELVLDLLPTFFGFVDKTFGCVCETFWICGQFVLDLLTIYYRFLDNFLINLHFFWYFLREKKIGLC